MGFEATSITYEPIRSSWVVRGFHEAYDGLVVSEAVMQQAGIGPPEDCKRIELNTVNLMAVYDPRDRAAGIIELEPLRNSDDWENGYGEIPF